MDDFDWTFGLLGVAGTRNMRIFTGILGLLAGGGIGYGVAQFSDVTALGAAGYTATAGLLGGVLGAAYSGLVIIWLVIVFGVAAVVLWQFMKG